MSNHEKQEPLVEVYFDVTYEERIRRFLELFSPTYKGYLLDQTPTQMHSREFMIRIYYEDSSSLTLTCYSAEMLQQRIKNIIDINKQVKFTNLNPNINRHIFSVITGKDVTVYYTATLEFEFKMS